LLHGLFIYFGDVLTTYAVCGWIATHWAMSKGPQRIKLSALRRIWKMWFVAAGVSVLVACLAGLLAAQVPSASELSRARFTETHSWQAFFQMNREFYGYVTGGAVTLLLPLYIWLTLSGMLAYRLRLFSKRRASEQWWQRAAGKAQTGISTAAVLAIAILATLSQTSEMPETFTSNLVFLSIPVGIWWVYCCVSIYMCKTSAEPTALLRQLARTARYTLPMYLGLSIILVLSHHPAVAGHFFHAPQHTLVTLFFLLILWLAAVKLALFADDRRWKDPLSVWLARSRMS
jgi:uncharacterized protein